MGPDLEMGWKPQQSDDAIPPIPLYYSFLLLKGRNEETPLELAIKVRNHKAIENVQM